MSEDQESRTSKALVNIEFNPDLKPMSELGHRIVDTMSAGMKTVYEDFILVRRAIKKAEASVIEAKAELAVSAIRDADPRTLEGRANLRLVHETIRQQENLETVIRHAVEFADEIDDQLKTIADADVPPIDEGWLFQFNDLCKKATKEDMQRLLGRVLAQEVKSPGNFSVRAIMTLTTISPREAEAFRKLCQIQIGGFDVLRLDDAWISNGEEYYGIRYSDLILCRSAGLIHDGDNLVYNHNINPGGLSFHYGGQIYILVADPERKISLPAIFFTTIGIELRQIIDVVPRGDFIDGFKEFMTKRKGILLDQNGFDEFRKNYLIKEQEQKDGAAKLGQVE